MVNTIDKSAIKTDLEQKLKVTNLSENEIKEIVPEILKLIDLKEDVENKQTESTTQNFLLDLRQDITDDSDVSINIKRNKGTVIGAMNFNTVTNNISITINQPDVQAGESTSEQMVDETVSAQPTTETVSAQPTTETVSAQPTTETVSAQLTTETVSAQPTTETVSAQLTTETVSAQPTTETVSAQLTTETVSAQPTTETVSAQLTTEKNNQSDVQDDIRLDSYEGYDKALSQLIFEIDGCTKTAKYSKGLNKSGKETLRTAKAKLKQYKDTISDKRRMLEHEYKQKRKLNEKNPDKVPLTLSISAAEINELKNIRFEWRKKIEVDIKEGQNGKSSNIAPRPNQSLEQIKQGNRVDSHHIEYDSKLNTVLRDAAFLRIMDNKKDRAREFLQGIANNSLSDAQIVFYQSNMGELSRIFDSYGMRDQVHRCIQTRGGRYNASYQNYGNMDAETAYKTGGVVGLLNNTLIKTLPNAKPEHVSNFTNIAVTVGGIYAIYRIGKWFFGKNKEGNRNLLGKTAGLASLYFVPQLLLGKDGYSLLGEILSGKADFSELKYRVSNSLWFLNGSSPEVYNQMAPGLLGMHIFPTGYTVAHVRALQQTFSDQNVRKQRYSVTYARLNRDNTALANEFKNTFNANEYKENEWKAFLTKLGIKDDARGDTVIFNEAAKTADKKTSFELWMKSQGKEKKSEFKKEIDNYLKEDGEFNPANLNPDWFKDNNEATYTMREVDFTKKEKLDSKVDNLPIDNQKKSELKTALESFYDERTIANKPDPDDFDLKMENGLLILKTNGGHESKIKLDTKEIEGFGPGIKFTDLADLLNTADLANKILETQKGKIAKDKPPFQYKPERKGICFNDATGLRQDLINRNNTGMDTRVLSTGRGGATSKIDTLYERPREFAKYLSDRREEENKVEIDATLYPIVNALSKTGITFTNEQEVKELENWLQQVKKKKEASIGKIDGDSFKTSRKWFDKKLVFVNVNGEEDVFDGDIPEKFPTIILNKDKFLNFMNDKNNGMWGSKLKK